MDTPYRVENVHRSHGFGSPRDEYALVKTGEGMVCFVQDLAFAYKLADLLNEDAHVKDIHR